jgi:homoserine O-acetyltransferase
MQEIQDECNTVNINSTHTIIDSDYGHDAFLVQIDKFQDIIKDKLKE